MEMTQGWHTLVITKVGTTKVGTNATGMDIDSVGSHFQSLLLPPFLLLWLRCGAVIMRLAHAGLWRFC